MSSVVGFGLMFGVEVWGTILESTSKLEITKKPYYNSDTGELLGYRDNYIRRYKLLMDIPGVGKVGDFVTEKAFENWVEEQYNHIDKTYKEDLFVRSWNETRFFGFKAFVGDELVEVPQDMCMDFHSDIDKAEKLWKLHYPYIPGKALLYMRISY